MPVTATKSQSTVGSKIYIVDRVTDPANPTIIVVPSLKGFTTIGGGKTTKVDKSNMDSEGFNENAPGRIDPGEGSGEIILMKSNPGHQKIKALHLACANGTIDGLDVFVGDGDGRDPPTLEGTDKVLTPPKTGSPAKWGRSGTIGRGYISNFVPKKVDNEIDRADFAIQWSGGYDWVVKGDPIALTH